MGEPLPVAVHILGKQLPVGGRRVCDGVSAGGDGGQDRLLRGAAGGDDGQLRIAGAYLRNDGGGAVGTGDVDKVDARGQLALQIHLFGYHGVYHGYLHGGFDGADGVVVDEGVAHHAESALMLRKGGHMRRALAVGQAAAYAHEHRHVRHADDGLGDTGLGREGVDGDNGVGVDVLDNGHIGAEHQ